MATAIHQYEDKLLDFAYGELPAPEASAVESHVKTCPRCSQALEQIRGVRVTMSQLPQEAAPTAGLESLLAYAEQAAKRTAEAPRAGAPWWRRMVAPLAGAAALMLVVVVYVRKDEIAMPSREDAALQATHDREKSAALAVAAEVVPAAPAGVAEKAAIGKVAGGARAQENERAGKENRNWDNDALAKNVDQKLGLTPDPAEERQAAQQRELGNQLGTANKISKTRRESAKDMPSNNDGFAELDAKPVTKSKPQADYANSRGGYQADKADSAKSEPKTEAKKKEAPPAEKPADVVAKPSPYGVSSGGGGLETGSAGPAPSAAAPTAQPQAAPPPPPKAPATNAPAAQVADESTGNSSLGLGVGSSYGTRGTKSAPKQIARSTTSAASNDDFDQAYGSDARKGNGDVARRDEESIAKGYLDSAKVAGNSGNRDQEVKLSLEVVNSNVKGYLRGEALARLCNALEALGNEAAADRYCDLLLREYPNTVAAREIANRRKNAQRAMKATKDSESFEPAKPTKPSVEPSGASSKAKKIDSAEAY
jgi:hypothetical protein